ncbi:MAG: hypothetical protein U0U70_13690 [Chitinophagaceae bacterium]
MKPISGIIFFLLMLLPAALPAQVRPSAKVTAGKNKILLGESFDLKMEIQLPAGAEGKAPVIDSLPHFEPSAPPQVDSSLNGGTKMIHAVYHLTSFDSGHWVIPAFVISKGLKTDTIGIDVVFSAFDPEQPYHDIKDIIEVKAEKKRPWWWYAAGGGLLVLLLLMYLLRRKKPALKKPIPVQQADPYEEAMRQLEELRRTKTEHKQYHSRLTAIFRQYLFRKKGILSLQKTTDDLVLQLRSSSLPKDDFEKLSQSLRLSDYVKFAKYEPTEEDNHTVYSDILNSIKQIEQQSSSNLSNGA